MFFWMASVAGLALAYLFGSTPTGYFAGKLLKGIDIRQHGSKSTGATNVLRTLRKWPALVVHTDDEMYQDRPVAHAPQHVLCPDGFSAMLPDVTPLEPDHLQIHPSR